MRERSVTIHASTDRREYFFSTDHCQGVSGRGEGTYPKGFVPITFGIPQFVAPRPSLPSGRITTVEELIAIYFPDHKEIPNPDPKYQL